MTTAAEQDLVTLDEDDKRALADLGFSLGARFADRRIDDLAAAREQWSAVCQAGIPAISLPAAYGGAGTMTDLALVAERIAAGGYPASKLAISTAVAGAVLARHGTAEQKERWLPGIADGAWRFCFAMTEPESGSNAARMKSRAVATDGGWLVSGSKTYISAVDDSDLMLLVTRDAEISGFSLFVVPLPNEQIQMHPVNVLAGVGERQWTLFFDGLFLPGDALIGEPGRGSRALFDGLNPERLLVAAEAIGLGRWCLTRAAEYAARRVVFDVPIGAHQAVQHPLAEALIELEAAWAMLERGARDYDADQDAGLACNMAKVKACDAGLRAADAALQTFGGSGFTDETMMFDRFGHLRLLRTAPVARELALNQIAVAGLGLPRSY
jgi:alkylation response protein AidB-like acyl-CoA dehydrogenase